MYATCLSVGADFFGPAAQFLLRHFKLLFPMCLIRDFSHNQAGNRILLRFGKISDGFHGLFHKRCHCFVSAPLVLKSEQCNNL